MQQHKHIKQAAAYSSLGEPAAALWFAQCTLHGMRWPAFSHSPDSMGTGFIFLLAVGLCMTAARRLRLRVLTLA